MYTKPVCKLRFTPSTTARRVASLPRSKASKSTSRIAWTMAASLGSKPGYHSLGQGFFALFCGFHFASGLSLRVHPVADGLFVAG